MNLNRGRILTSMPGPSVIPDRVLNAMHASMPNIYEGALIETSMSVLNELPAIARTTGQVFMAISNGHGAWEMSLTNTLSRGDKVLVLESGRFAVGWGEQASMLGAQVEVLHAPDRCPVDPDAVEERLRADTEHSIKAILAVQVDTASGVWNDLVAIGRAIKAAGHPALYMADCIASIGCIEFLMDDWGVDLTVGGSQKGLMVPPGLGLVWVNNRAMAAHKKADMRTPYWDWTARLADDAHYKRYCGTAPIHHIYAMRAALDMIAEEGLEAIWRRHAIFANAVHAAVEAWSVPGGLEFNIIDSAHRSHSTTTVLSGAIDSELLCKTCENDAGLILGIGLGDLAGRSFRIGHMGHLNPPMLLGTLSTIEAALTAMNAPMGASGAAAAASVIADALRA